MSDVVVRHNYFERQVLRTQDFTDEQAYHIAMRRIHNIAQHSWGIVAGLELDVTDGTPYVQPGFAIDGYGRELVLTEKTPVPVGRFVELGQGVLDVVLVYGLQGSDQAPAGYAGCGDVGDLFYRWVEQPTVRLKVPPEDDPPDRRAPEDVPEGDRPFPSSRIPPDDPARGWPVFLGQLQHDPSKPDSPYLADPAGRPYVGLAGERIDAPSGLARVQVGAERGEDPRRFAVWISQPGGGTLEPEPRLEIDQDGQAQVRGDLTVDGDLTVGNAVGFAVGTAELARSPWSLYAVEDPADPEGASRQLRIEIPARAGGTGPVNEVVIGRWVRDPSGTEAFQACLTVRDDCTVTVSGDLVVQGTITSGGDVVSSGLSEDARRALLSSYLTGVGGGSALLNRFYRSPFPDEAGAVGIVDTVGLGLLASEGGLHQVARGLAESPERRQAFTALVQARYPELARALHQDLRGGAERDAGGEPPGQPGEKRGKRNGRQNNG